MRRDDRPPAFVVTVHKTGSDATRVPAHTAKAARHYAKGVCGNPLVERITLAGHGVVVELYSRGAAMYDDDGDYWGDEDAVDSAGDVARGIACLIVGLGLAFVALRLAWGWL